MTTQRGVVKKTKISQFKNIRKNGLIAIKLDKGDVLKWVERIEEGTDVIVVTKDAHSIRFSEKDVRDTGRSSRGVRAIKMLPENEVVGVGSITDKSDLLIVTKNGFGKKSKVSQYNTQSRGGKGVFAAKINAKTGKIASVKIVKEEKEALIISDKGQIIKIDISSVPRHNRHTSGVKLINLKKDDYVSTVECS